MYNNKDNLLKDPNARLKKVSSTSMGQIVLPAGQVTPQGLR